MKHRPLVVALSARRADAFAKRMQWDRYECVTIADQLAGLGMSATVFLLDDWTRRTDAEKVQRWLDLSASAGATVYRVTTDWRYHG